VGGRRHGGVVAERPHDADEEPGDAEEPGAASQLPTHGLGLVVVTGDVLALRRLADRAPLLFGAAGLAYAREMERSGHTRCSRQLENGLLDLGGSSRGKGHLRTDRVEARLLEDPQRAGVVACSAGSDRTNRDLLEEQAERPRCDPRNRFSEDDMIFAMCALKAFRSLGSSSRSPGTCS